MRGWPLLFEKLALFVKKAWEQELAERQEWDATLMDGMAGE